MNIMKLAEVFPAVLVVVALFAFVPNGFPATGLKLNPDLNYSSDSDDGPLITGDNMSDGEIKNGKPAYVIFYHRECYNSKRQARRTVELYQKYNGEVDFIVVDLNSPLSKEQKDLRDRHYKNYIPHVTLYDKEGKVVYDGSGEVSNDKMSGVLDPLL
ncbi:MAG: hypothetical protein RIG61_12230 [Deltaproteobacteria bacterium]